MSLANRLSLPLNAEKDVAVAGTPEALATAETVVRQVVIRAKPTNTGAIAVGDESVDAGAGLNAAYLEAGETMTLGPADLADWFIDAEVSGEGVVLTGEDIT